MNRLRQILTHNTHSVLSFIARASVRRTLVTGFFGAALALSLGGFAKPVFSVSFCHGSKNINVVAHQDDDILFLSPDLLTAIRDGECVRTVYVTAGDDGRTVGYWSKREEGAKAAYAMMAQTNNVWDESTVETQAGSVHLSVLKDDPRISLMFMRLPDGDHNGAGFRLNDHQSLQKLWDGSIPTMDAVDHQSEYSRDSMISVIAELIRNYGPTTVNTQDYAGKYGDGDHSDHHTVAYITRIAEQDYQKPHNFVGYEDYTTSRKPPNVTSQDYLLKQEAFFAYAAHDPHVCDTEAICSHLGYGAWLPRQYTLPFTITGGALPGIALRAPMASDPTRLAFLQGGVIASDAVPISARISLLDRDVTPVAKHAASSQASTPAPFHLPFVGLDVPQITYAHPKDDDKSIVMPSQPAIVVIRGWVSDNELSEATTSTV